MHMALLTYWRHWLQRPAWVGSLSLAAYTLCWPTLLGFYDPLMLLLIGLHSVWIGIRIGGVRGSEAEFLYSRGYSRNTLWLHAQLAGLIAVLLTCLPSALFIWLRIRSGIQSRLSDTSTAAFMAPREDVVPLAWLMLYVLFVPLCALAAARRRHADGTVLLIIGIAVSVFTLFNTRNMIVGISGTLALAAALAISSLALTASHAVQQEQEVDCE